MIQIAYIYGSFLRSDDFRDIDIALAISRENVHSLDPIGLRMRIITSLSRRFRLPQEFDVHLLHEMPLALQYEVIATGKCILCRDAKEKVTYETRVLNEFLDFKPAHDWLVDQSLKRAARGELGSRPAWR